MSGTPGSCLSRAQVNGCLRPRARGNKSMSANLRAILSSTALTLGFAALAAPIAGQWVNHPTRGLPRTADGKPDLSAPTPRTRDGQVDLSGIWLSERDPKGTLGGIEGIVAPRSMINIMADLKPDEVPFQPSAEALYKQRGANLFRDNPMIRCLPPGVPRLDAYTHPYKIVQTPELIVVLYESQTMFRQIFLDGRALPQSPEPSWMGYSVGRWDGNALVVETTGFNDKTWLDGSGHPHSDKMRLTERFVRRNFGQMDIEITVDDPVMYTKPLRYTQPQKLLPDTDLLEYVCDNLKEPPRTR